MFREEEEREMGRAIPIIYGGGDQKGEWAVNGKRRTIEKKWTNSGWTLSLLAE